MILTDGVHLVSNVSEEELHAFASSMGLKKEWFQFGRHPHYDLTTKRASNRAIVYGAKYVTTRELLKAIRCTL